MREHQGIAMGLPANHQPGWEPGTDGDRCHRVRRASVSTRALGTMAIDQSQAANAVDSWRHRQRVAGQ